MPKPICGRAEDAERSLAQIEVLLAGQDLAKVWTNRIDNPKTGASRVPLIVGAARIARRPSRARR